MDSSVISVKLDAFDGPLDLLLHLIEKNKIDIFDIPIVQITEQYLEIIAQMDRKDMDVMSDFLVMAATLLKIKSKMLLPVEVTEEGEPEDPRAELVERLLEYKTYKYASYELKDKQMDAARLLFKESTIPAEIADIKEEVNVEEIKNEEKTVTETLRVETVKEEKPTEQNVETEVPKREETVFADEYFEIVGQVFDSYIIAEKGDEMMIIDQHAAHERLKYEELKKDIASKQVVSQMLIEPVIVNLTGSEMTAYRDNKQLFDDIGFESEEFGDDAVIVRSVPGEVELGEVEPLVLELVAQGEELRKELITEKNERLLYTIACKSAVKANMRMSKIEMETLVRNVLRLKNINTCPHGRPIIVTMSKKELEKEFKRIV